MRALLPDPPPPEFEAVLERRRREGSDTRDEVWDGVLHVNPAPHGRHAALQAQTLVRLAQLAAAAGLEPVGELNIGEPDNYRVPDAALLAPGSLALYHPTAALVVEILSPGDEAPAKLPFYADRGVTEVVVIDPDRRRVDWLALDAVSGAYRPAARSALVDCSAGELTATLAWPV